MYHYYRLPLGHRYQYLGRSLDVQHQHRCPANHHLPNAPVSKMDYLKQSLPQSPAVADKHEYQVCRKQTSADRGVKLAAAQARDSIIPPSYFVPELKVRSSPQAGARAYTEQISGVLFVVPCKQVGNSHRDLCDDPGWIQEWPNAKHGHANTHTVDKLYLSPVEIHSTFCLASRKPHQELLLHHEA